MIVTKFSWSFLMAFSLCLYPSSTQFEDNTDVPKVDNTELRGNICPISSAKTLKVIYRS